MWAKQKQPGFTIVELLIVIVVIGILAAITIVAYNGIQERARAGSLSSALSQAAKKIAVWQVDNPDTSPASLSVVGVSDTNDIAYQYTQTDSSKSYCLTATGTTATYYISPTSGGPKQGTCSGYNLLVWNKSKPGETPPVPTATVDTSVFRTSTASMRIGPNAPGQNVKNNPYGGTVGQTYTVSMWVLSDSSWNGTVNNSKIRFGSISSGLPLASCSYNGPKSSWTFVTCSFTLTSAEPQTSISIGNDGTIGNIWVDDLTISRS
jgi:prepilin-type N-terminal cleavage/methylation domain-containing protein